MALINSQLLVTENYLKHVQHSLSSCLQCCFSAGLWAVSQHCNAQHWPLEHPCPGGPAQWDASLFVSAAGQGRWLCTGSRSLQGFWAMRGQQGATSSHCHSKPVICHDELCPTGRAAQGPLQAGCDSWSGAGRLGGELANGKAQDKQIRVHGRGEERNAG